MHATIDQWTIAVISRLRGVDKDIVDEFGYAIVSCDLDHRLEPLCVVVREASCILGLECCKGGFQGVFSETQLLRRE